MSALDALYAASHAAHAERDLLDREIATLEGRRRHLDRIIVGLDNLLYDAPVDTAPIDTPTDPAQAWDDSDRLEPVIDRSHTPPPATVDTPAKFRWDHADLAARYVAAIEAGQVARHVLAAHYGVPVGRIDTQLHYLRKKGLIGQQGRSRHVEPAPVPLVAAVMAATGMKPAPRPSELLAAELSTADDVTIETPATGPEAYVDDDGDGDDLLEVVRRFRCQTCSQEFARRALIDSHVSLIHGRNMTGIEEIGIMTIVDRDAAA